MALMRSIAPTDVPTTTVPTAAPIYMTKEVPIQLPRKVADSALAADHPQKMWRRQRLAAVIDNAPSTGHGELAMI